MTTRKVMYAKNEIWGEDKYEITLQVVSPVEQMHPSYTYQKFTTIRSKATGERFIISRMLHSGGYDVVQVSEQDKRLFLSDNATTSFEVVEKPINIEKIYPSDPRWEKI